jgi:BlaI family transcriptional regulator, penicillinase repressor
MGGVTTWLNVRREDAIFQERCASFDHERLPSLRIRTGFERREKLRLDTRTNVLVNASTEVRVFVPNMNRTPLSKAELEVARVLWTLGKGTVRQVHQALPAGRRIDFGTVQTYLRRLEAKGYARAQRQGKTNVYKPAVRPKQVIRDTVDDLMKRLFSGEAIPLLRHLIHERGISREELEELRGLIQELEEQNHGKS